ncbi:MAG: ABC transporter ATP-binding protein [Patescibacteria group bacterium]|jgi:putative ABC transport system ATP-binding protein
MSILINVENLQKVYLSGDIETRVLRGITFKIEKGEFVSIMGPSGSGKSTLMHILGLLDRASSGLYEFEGVDVTKLSDNELAKMRNEKIGFVFQAFNLLPRTSVLENVKLPLAYSNDKSSMDSRAGAILKNVGLEHRLTYFTNQISGGEKQRVAIARALVNEPSIIFADEPTGNLDSKSGTQIMEILQHLNNEGNTIVMVTHETYTSEHAKRIIKIMDGRIVDDYLVAKRRIAKDGEMLK